MDENKIQVPSGNDKKVIKFGLGILIVVFVIFGGWMTFAPLATYSVGVGKVSADYEKKSVQHLEGGIIESIYVKDGDFVKKDQTLMKLKDIQIKSQLDIYKSQYQDALALHARLLALTTQSNSIDFPEELIDENAIKTQKKIFEATTKSLKDEMTVYENRIIQVKNQIDGLSSLLTSKTNRLKSINEEIVEWEELYKLQLIDKIKIRDLQREANLLEGEIANAKAEIARLHEQKDETKLQQLLREEEFRKETLNQQVEAKSLVFDLKSKILAYQDTLTRTEIKAPNDGIVVGLNVYTIGGVIPQGKTILDIVPQNHDLIIVAQIPTTDRDKVATGLHTDIRFSAFNVQQTHVIDGTVTHVSADSFVDEQSGASYYEVKVVPTQSGFEQIGKYGFELVAGMPAEVMIKTGERTGMSYLLKPFMDMLSRGFNEE